MSNSFIANVNLLVSKLSELTDLNDKFPVSLIEDLSKLSTININTLSSDLEKGTYDGLRQITIDLLENYLDYKDSLTLEEKEALYLDETKMPKYDAITITLLDGTSTKVMFTQDNVEFTLGTNQELYEFLFENTTINTLVEDTLFRLVNKSIVGQETAITDNIGLFSNIQSITLHCITPELCNNSLLTKVWSSGTSSLMFVVNYMGHLVTLLNHIEEIVEAPQIVSSLVQEARTIYEEIKDYSANVNSKYANIVDIQSIINGQVDTVSRLADETNDARDSALEYKNSASASATEASVYTNNASGYATSAENSATSASRDAVIASEKAIVATEKAEIAINATVGIEEATTEAKEEISSLASTLSSQIQGSIQNTGSAVLDDITETGKTKQHEVESWAVGSVAERPEGSAKFWAEQAEDKVGNIEEKVIIINNTVNTGIETLENKETEIINNVTLAGTDAVEQARDWAIGTISEQPNGSAKYWAGLAEQITTGGQNWANEDLSNLSSIGNAKFTVLDDKIDDNLVIINNSLAQVNVGISSNEDSIELVKQAVIELSDRITTEEDKITLITNGGTGANTAEEARTNLGIYSKSEVDSFISSADIVDATELVAGKVRFSTTVEYNAGTSENTVINPKQVQTSISDLQSAIETVSNSIAGTAALGVASHDTSITAHTDIRQSIEDESNSARVSAIQTSNTYTDTKFANIGNATTAVAGMIEIATQAEVTTGTDTNKAVVPSTLSQYVVPIKNDISSLETTVANKMSGFYIQSESNILNNDDLLEISAGDNVDLQLHKLATMWDTDRYAIVLSVPDASNSEKGAVQLCDVISTYNPSTLQATTESAVVAYSANKTLSNVDSVSPSFQNVLVDYFATKTLGNVTSLAQSFIDLLEESGAGGTASVVETWKSSDGSSWYRKWSDGFIEQGGSISHEIECSPVEKTISFPLNFSTTTYSGLVIDVYKAIMGSDGPLWASIAVKRNISMDIQLLSTVTGCVFKSTGLCWYAAGY